MSLSTLTLITSVVGVFWVHSILPHHWLPFVIVGREQRWPMKKTLTVLSIAAVFHSLSTLAVAFLVSYVGNSLDAHLETLHGVVPGLILLAFGAGYIVSDWHHRHHEVSNKMAASSLVLMLTLSPCVVVAPFFMLMGPLPVVQILQVSVVMILVSVISMMALAWMVLHGIKKFELNWLEHVESRVMGGLLMVMGLFFILS